MVNHKRKYYRAALEKEVIFSIIPCVKKESNRRALSARRLLRYGFQISAHHLDCLCADAHKEYAVVAERYVVFCSCRVVLMQESAVEAVNCHRSGFGEGDADAVGCCGNRSAVIAGGYALHSVAAFHFLWFRAVGRCLFDDFAA